MAIGALTGAVGLYFGMVGLGTLPPPSKINGPVWIALCAGLAFLSAGIAVIVRGALRLDDSVRELPASASVWLKTVYWLTGLVAAAGLAGICTWVAFGPGTREFHITGPISGPGGEAIGRTLFGIGAIATWLLVAAIAYSCAKKIFGKNN